MSYSEEEYHKLEEENIRLCGEIAAERARMGRLLDHLAICDVPTNAPAGSGYCLAPGGTVRCHHFFKRIEDAMPAAESAPG